MTDSPPSASSIGFARVLVSLLQPNWPAWSLIGLLLSFQAASHLATPLFYKLIFDRVIGNSDTRALALLLVGMGVLFAFMVLSELGQGALSSSLGVRTANRLRLILVRHLHRLPVDYFLHARAGDVLARFTGDIGAVERLVSVTLYKVAMNGLVAVLCIGALFVVEWRLACFTLAMFPLVVALPRVLGTRAAEAGYVRRQNDGRLSTAVQEMLAAHRVIRAFSIEEHHLRRFSGVLAAIRAAARRAALLDAYVEKTANLGLIFAQLAIVGLGAWLVTRNSLSVGDLAAFVGFLLNASGAVAALTAHVPDGIQAGAALRRIQEVLGTPAGPPRSGDAPSLPRLAKEIRFENVGLSYGDVTALDHVSFAIRAGQSVALVGRSGSGKSTVVNLIMRFHEPTSGVITMDGCDIVSISPESLRAQIGCVFQSTFLFDMSVRENIRQGRLDATDGEVEAAARAAMLEETILRLPLGYDTPVGEAGSRLSGGQQQRLAVARAILRDPAILVLDEPTSALDPSTEDAVNQTLDALSRGRTRVCVTHRLSVAAGMDQILVFDHGRVVEQGTHASLLARNGTYATMWQRQSSLMIDASGTRGSLNGQFLRTVPFFKELDDRHIESLADQFASELHEPGVTVIERGEISDKFYVIVRGRVEVLLGPDADDAGAAANVPILEQGDFFGEIALINDTRRNATVRTLDRSILLTLTRAQFQTILDESPRLRERLEAIVKSRLAQVL